MVKVVHPRHTKNFLADRHYSEKTGKLHLPCPYPDLTGVEVHVIIKNGYCYRSGQCMVIKCKFNKIQGDLDKLLSLVW